MNEFKLESSKPQQLVIDVESEKDNFDNEPEDFGEFASLETKQFKKKEASDAKFLNKDLEEKTNAMQEEFEKLMGELN